jgi:tetratricopeptide (TPR) repeat protein
MTGSRVKVSHCLAGAVMVALFFPGPSYAHGDLALQIEQVSAELALAPESVDLYLQRATLYRRHGDWELGQSDVDTLRSLAPDNGDLDLLEGRLAADSGNWPKATPLLSRYLLENPHSTSALLARAKSLAGMGRNVEAARDYEAVIGITARPSPELYGFLVRSLIRAGEPKYDQASDAAARGLAAFPGDPSLLGYRVDLALYQQDLPAAERAMDSLPEAVRALPQWRFRSAIAACLDGDGASAAASLDDLKSQSGSGRAGTWNYPSETLTFQDGDIDPKACHQASREQLNSVS